MTSGPDQLRDWMNRRGLNQAETADLMGFDQTYISQLLSGRRHPSLRNAIRIQRETGIAPDAWLSSQLDETNRPIRHDANKA